jgi:bacterioferritin
VLVVKSKCFADLAYHDQSWLHYRLLANWGLLEMAKVWRKESIEEMQHADRITDRGG